MVCLKLTHRNTQRGIKVKAYQEIKDSSQVKINSVVYIDELDLSQDFASTEYGDSYAKEVYFDDEQKTIIAHLIRTKCQEYVNANLKSILAEAREQTGQGSIVEEYKY